MKIIKIAHLFFVAMISLAFTVSHVNASAIYMVGGSGEIRSFTGLSDGATPIIGNNFINGTLASTITNYGSYLGFTQASNGKIYGVDSAGSVDSWNSLTQWLAGGIATSESSGKYAAGSLHGISYDGNTGGFYVVYEGVNDGDIGEYATINDFVNNTNASISNSVYRGNLFNFYYPDEDSPGGANYIQANGGGLVEGFSSLADYIASPFNRTFTDSGYRVGAAFSVVANPVPEPSTFALLALGLIVLASRRFRKQS